MLLDTSKIIGKRVYVKTSENAEEIEVKQLGRLRVAIFHPVKNVCIGALIRRPDIAMMFHRSDAFCALPLFEIDEDGEIILAENYADESKKFLKSEKINTDACVIWDGMPVQTQSGELLGIVEKVLVDEISGKLKSILVAQNATSKALLGTREIPDVQVIGFDEGSGIKLVSNNETDTGIEGCILVKDSASDIDLSGGAAEKAAKASVKATQAVKKAGASAKTEVAKAANNAKPKISQAAKTAEKATQEGAFTLGKQIGKTKSAFTEFKDNLMSEMNK